MNNLKRYEGLIIFVIVMGLITYLWANKLVIPTYENYKATDTKREQTNTILSAKQDRKTNVETRLKEAKFIIVAVPTPVNDDIIISG